MHRPTNIWVITENEFQEFTATGGKVIYIYDQDASDPPVHIATHPFVVGGGALLPPIDSIEAELEGYNDIAAELYANYLSGEVADIYIAIILAAALQQIPIAIMFGKDELQFQFPMVFIDYMYKRYGLIFGVKNKVNPSINEDMLPFILAKLYNMNIIDYPNFMMMHPANLPISPEVISKMAFEARPLIKSADELPGYFELVKQRCHAAGKFLIDPMEAL